MDFRSYSGSDTRLPRRDASRNDEKKQEQAMGGMNEADIRRAINHFSKMSNDQLMRELSRHLSKKKAQGRENEITAVIERIKPFLNDEQRRRLSEIMENY